MSQSLSIPPYFDGSNYAYWKVRIRAFLKSLDEHVWLSVKNGWKPPSTIVSGTVNLTDISLWTKDKIAECNWNRKRLHALFMVVSPKEFRRVSMCETAKEVWDILETTHEGTKTDESSDTESLRDDEIAYFVKKFQKALKNRRKPQDRKSRVPSRFSKEKTERFNNKSSSDKPRLVRCHECQGIGHYRNECPSYKKNQRIGQGKALVVSLTDNKSETSDRQESSSSEDEGNYMAFVSTIKSESDKEKKERHASNLQNSLKSVSELKCVNEKLEDKVKTLTSELEKSNAHLQTFISGTKKLDDILGMNKPTGDRKGLGYVEGNTHGVGPSKTVFISASRKSNAVNSPNKGKNVSREQSHQSRRNFMPKHPQTCTYCGALGHTRPRCYKLGNERRNRNIPSQVSFLTNQVSHLTEMLTKLTRSTTSSKKVWVKKEDLAGLSGQVNCYVALKAQDFNMWYFDSACSRHMCGNKTLFILLMNAMGVWLPLEMRVLHLFLAKRCTVYDSFGGVVLEGVRTSDNCYRVLPNSNYVCRSAKMDMSELWHKRLGHLNYKSLVQLAKKELVNGLPKIGPSENVVTESLGGKRYILVVVDDFSRFTWVELFREKSDACDLIKSFCKRLSNKLNHKVSRMRSDHGKEFENFNLESFCMDEGILHEFFSPITPQQNGVVERKNRVL
ncbi:uncharacterized protein LOC111392800 [Olea europaea var. sylvestris]|uniref:uncharacterized protein LOC111392800 n=1 Tax=Olea europaea var. sylvestris TaxID=158386 RepID=UPI000C1CEAB0|nr:uncharacterized protein LOC111392800 [Olea europaea var. sylvestris]